MATKPLPISTSRTQKFLEDLESHLTVLTTCTNLFKALSAQFTSLEASLAARSQTLDSKFDSFRSLSDQTLLSLSRRESSIPQRESAALTSIDHRKSTALSDIQGPRQTSANLSLSDALRLLSRRMDSSGLLKFVITKRKESASLRVELAAALAEEALDSVRLVLDAAEEFVTNKVEKIGVTDKRWACGMLVQAVFPEGSFFGGKEDGGGKGPRFARSVVERAASILDMWKDGGGGVVGPAEAVMFLQMVVGFGLKSRYDEEWLRKLVMEHATRRDMAKVAAAVGFGEKMGDIIDELVKNGKEVEAVHFAFESGLTERFPPVPLLKSYLKKSRKNTTTMSKNGKYSAFSVDESTAVELNSIKAVIKCVEDHKLESKFSLDTLSKRAAQLEKNKLERKKSAVAGAARPQNKRGHGTSGGGGHGSPAFRPAKAAKFSNAYSSSVRRNPAPPAQHSPVARYSGLYSYPSQSVYDGHTATQYTSTYGVTHSQTSAAISQQHYSLAVDNATAAVLHASGSYGSQTTYGPYNYGSGAPTT